jgi:hypothetical protein
MTKEEFIKRYISNSGMPREDFAEYFIALPCQCGAQNCDGWAAVFNDRLMIDIHNELYGAKDD